MNDTVQSSQPINCPCGDNDGLWCSLSGCPYPRLGPNEPLIFSDYVLHPAIKDVLEERLRQQSVEGWSLEHDDVHSSGEMAAAAATYAYSTTLSDRHRQYVSGIYSIENSATLRDLWPASWSKSWWKPTDRRCDLVKAAALLVAEIERLDRYARQSQLQVNRPDANAPNLLEQGRPEEQRQPDQGMTSTSGDAQTSYPPVDCSNGTAPEQLAREGSCNASSLERSGSIDAEVDNTTVTNAPAPQTHVKGSGDTIMKADVEKMIRDWQAECADHPSLHNQGNVLLDRLKALKPSLAMNDFLAGMDCLAQLPTRLTPLEEKYVALAKEIVKGNGFNHPDPRNDNMRLVGFRVPVKIAGLSEALFALDAIRAVTALATEGKV